jgi:GNAT superfamily N-acetyltransferase
MSEAFLLPRLERALACAGGTHDFKRDVVPMLLDGRAQWWGLGEGAIVTELVRYPNFNAVNYWLVAGKLDDVLALQPEIERWARMQGCARAIGVGRPGWLRVLRKYGYRPLGTAFAKELTS